MLVPKASVLVVPTLTANAEKLTYAAKHGVPVVSEKWLFSSIEKGEKLPMRDYLVTSADTKRVTMHQHPNHSRSRAGSAVPQKEKR